MSDEMAPPCVATDLAAAGLSAALHNAIGDDSTVGGAGGVMLDQEGSTVALSFFRKGLSIFSSICRVSSTAPHLISAGAVGSP